MKQGKLFWGTFFLATGLLGFLYEIGLQIHFGFDSDIVIPLLLVLLGLTFIIKGNSTILVIIVIAGLIASIMVYSNIWDDTSSDDSLFKIKIKIENENNDETNDVSITENSDTSDMETETIPFYDLDEIKLKLVAAASEMNLKGIKTEDFTAKLKGLRYEMKFDENNGKGNLQIIHQKGENSNALKLKKINILVNRKPKYIVKIKSAASDLDLDFSGLKLKRIKGEFAATDADIKLGNEVDELNAEFEFAASQLTIYIPRNTGCIIRGDLALVGKSFPGFVNIDDRTFRTKNYDEAKKKIKIIFKGALSGLDVKLY